MMVRKRMIMRGAFVAEIILFTWFYYYGMCGMREIRRLRVENDQLEQQIGVANDCLAQKEQELAAWQSDPFYKEKLAREQLHMAKEGEEIYLVDRG